MTMRELIDWVEANPGKSILIGGGLVLFLLWIFGAFSKAQADSGSSLAAAYYAAEAQQAVVGGQIQMATITSAAQTAQSLISANAAEAINTTNATAATTINSQNAGAAQTINAQNSAVLSGMFSDQLQATQINATAAQNINATNTAAAVDINNTNANAAQFITMLHTIIPQELAFTGGGAVSYSAPGQGQQVFGPEGGTSPNQLIAQGYPPDIAQALSLNVLSHSGVFPVAPPVVAVDNQQLMGGG